MSKTETLNEENEQLIARVKALESQVRYLKTRKGSWGRLELDDMTPFGIAKAAVAVVTVTVGAVTVCMYTIYKLGMEFVPSVMGPVSSVFSRAVSALFS